MKHSKENCARLFLKSRFKEDQGGASISAESCHFTVMMLHLPTAAVYDDDDGMQKTIVKRRHL